MAMENVTATVVPNVSATAGNVNNIMQQIVDKIVWFAVTYGPNLIAAFLIFFIGKWVARILADILEKGLIKSKVNQTLAIFARNLIYYTLFIFVVIAALDKMGVSATPFTAIIAAAGLAVGFALQGTLANFAAGVMIILFQPFGVGDTIEAGGATGTVKEIQVFSTILTTSDNKKVIVPNAKITSDKITINLAGKK